MQTLLKLSLLLGALLLTGAQYTPDWTSLDSRPLPKWYDEAKIGIFLHWGVFSVPSFGSEWFWAYWHGHNKDYDEFMKKNYPPGFKYPDFAPHFTAEFFEPNEWAKLFKESGARYVVLTSKHHEGFTLWPSETAWNWNSVDTGPKRDLVGDLGKAIVETTDLKFGLYHSLYDWFHPLYLEDKKNGFKTDKFVKGKTMPELYDLVNTYKPDLIWSDGDWEALDSYWTSKDFLAWLFNESPVKDTVVVNDRWGKGIPCHHGSYYTCSDRYNPGVLQKHKWENAMTLDKRSWGYRRNSKLNEYLTIEELLKTMAETISCGGNLLINAGPTHEGTIPIIMEERLRQFGTWLGINGQAIYATKPWVKQNDTSNPHVWYTARDHFVNAILLEWPEDGQVVLGSVASTPQTVIVILGNSNPGYLQFKDSPDGLKVVLPPRQTVKSDWAFVLKMFQVSHRDGRRRRKH